MFQRNRKRLYSIVDEARRYVNGSRGRQAQFPGLHFERYFPGTGHIEVQAVLRVGKQLTDAPGKPWVWLIPPQEDWSV
jgi:hypothetical protein